jgi:N4-gp56 family major capsid protein
MKDSMQELGATPNATTTSTAGLNSIVTGVVGKVWLNELIQAAKKKMFFEQFAYVTNAPKGAKDVAVPLYTSNISFSLTTAQATTRTFTTINNLQTVVFTPTTKKFGAAISKDVVRTSQVDTVRFAREQMVYDAAINIDLGFDTLLHSAAAYSGNGPAALGPIAGTGTNAILYASRANEAALVAGDTLSTDIVARANRILKAKYWYPEADRPFVLFIPAVCEEALLRDSQFVNAAEYGSNDVVMNGEIGKYLGIKVISTENCTAVTLNSLAGHYCYLVKAKVSYGIVYGERPSLDAEYRKNQAEYRVYLDMCYDQKVLQDSAIQVICVLDQ